MIDVVRSEQAPATAPVIISTENIQTGVCCERGWERYRVARVGHAAAWGRGIVQGERLRQFTRALCAEDRRRFTLQFYAAMCARTAKEGCQE